MQSPRRYFHLWVHGFLGLMLIVLSSCHSELKEVCSAKNDSTFTDAISQIEPWRDSYLKKRSLASVPDIRPEPDFEMDQDERERWESWSQSQLKRVETYIDWANLHRAESSEIEMARRSLTDIANRLVAFHGYAEGGRVLRMLDTLKQVESDRQEVLAIVCANR